MALQELWADDWIIVEEVVQGKQIVTAIDFRDIRTIVADSKLSSSKLKRYFTLHYEDGTIYEIPIEATVVDAPLEFKQLIARLARGIQVE